MTSLVEFCAGDRWSSPKDDPLARCFFDHDFSLCCSSHHVMFTPCWADSLCCSFRSQDIMPCSWFHHPNSAGCTTMHVIATRKDIRNSCSAQFNRMATLSNAILQNGSEQSLQHVVDSLGTCVLPVSSTTQEENNSCKPHTPSLLQHPLLVRAACLIVQSRRGH